MRSVMHMARVLVCGFIVAAAGRAEPQCDVFSIPGPDRVPGVDFTPGRLFVVVRASEQDLISKLSEAAALSRTITGVAVFDSVSLVHGLQRVEKPSESFGEAFYLHFRTTANIGPIAEGYCGLSLLELVIVDVLVPTATTGETWGEPKKKPACDVLITVPSKEGPGEALVPGRIYILVRASEDALATALTAAAAGNQTYTGVGLFDSVGAGLQLERVEVISDGTGRAFVLHFPESSNMGTAADEYCRLPYLEIVSVDIRVPTVTRLLGWGEIKESL